MFGKLLALVLLATVVFAVAAHQSVGRAPERPYVVKSYDTLWTIATSHYAGDPREGVWRLQRRNRLEGTTIVPGQRLVLP
ncbi:MAG: LysM peptidoglycan-binding domain-containing protein [Actinobacteria bacterium]|nr:LysM peptidoglycan-binding domain-containing protein [Actinomycetota bacterium]